MRTRNSVCMTVPLTHPHRMNGHARLLAFINALRLLQASLTLLDDRLPSILFFPLSELLSLAAGTLLVVCAYFLLLHVSVAGPGVRHSFQGDHSLPRRGLKGGGPDTRQPGFCTTITFLVFSSSWTLGLGMHTAAVIIGNQLSPDDTLYPLVNDYLHRFWSHHIYELGFFGLLLLLVWTEANSYDPEARNVARSSSSMSSNKPPPTLHNICKLLEYLWSVVLGFSYAIVARATQTVALTSAFYLAVISIHVYVRLRLPKWPSITASVTVSSIAGICLMVCLYVYSFLD